MQHRITDYFHTPLEHCFQTSCSLSEKKHKTKNILDLNTRSSLGIPSIVNKPDPHTVIYKHDLVLPIYFPKSDYFGIYAKDNIPAGTMLVFEHAIVDYFDDLVEWVTDHTEISCDLYPRTEYSLQSFKNKVSYNIWEWYEKGDPIEFKRQSALCPFISKFNHSCNPNAFSTRYTENCTVDNFQGYFIIYATYDIKQGDEICVSYGWDVGHTNTHFNWKCDCGLNLRERSDIFVSNVKFVEHCLNEDRDHIYTQLNERCL